MTSRERVQCILRNELPDRLPFNFWMDRSLMAKLDQELGENFRICHYDADVIESGPWVWWFPELADRWERVEERGIVWVKKYPLETADDLDLLVMPDMEIPGITAGIRADREKYPDRAIFVPILHPFEMLANHFGFENLFYALYDDEDRVMQALDDLSKAIARLTERVMEEDIDVVYLMGDICTTKGEIMSRDMLRKFCFDPMKPAIEAAHAKGMKVFMHTDGNVMNILDLFVEYGIDGINPLQSNCNDKEVFARDYGDKLMLYGGIDNCFVIPNGTVEEVRQHIRDNFRILGKNGRYIPSSHDIPETVPMENVDAMVDELKKCTF